MKRGPKSGQHGSTDFVAKARDAWGDAIPDWVEALAEEATRTTATAAAGRIGYATAVVSNVLGNKYPGDVARVEEKVRGALMGATVQCPVYGALGRDRCLDNQKLPFAATSSLRVKCFHACRSGCVHSRLAGKGGSEC